MPEVKEIKENKIYADLVQTKKEGAEKGELDTFILLKGKDYAEGTRLLSITVEEFKAIYSMVYRMIQKQIEDEKKDAKT